MSRPLGYFVRLNPAGRDQVRIVQELKRRGIPFTVIGGVAMAAYRPARQTKDVDLIVEPPRDMSLGELADQLALLVKNAKARLSSHEPHKEYYRIRIERKGKRPVPVADVAPPDLYPQYAAAHAHPRRMVIQDFEGYGTVQVAGREEMLALKTKAALSKHRSGLHAWDDRADANWLSKGANFARVKGLVTDVQGGSEFIDLLAAEREAERRRPNWRPRHAEERVPRVPSPLGVRCPACGRVVRIVRGGRLRAHDFQYRRCVGSGAGVTRP